MNNYYSDTTRGVIWVIEVMEDGRWGHHGTAGTRAQARERVRQRRQPNQAWRIRLFRASVVQQGKDGG